jgi:hypothetical protein
MILSRFDWNNTIGMELLNTLITLVRDHLSPFGKTHPALLKNTEVMLTAFSC